MSFFFFQKYFLFVFFIFYFLFIYSFFCYFLTLYFFYFYFFLISCSFPLSFIFHSSTLTFATIFLWIFPILTPWSFSSFSIATHSLRLRSRDTSDKVASSLFLFSLSLYSTFTLLVCLSSIISVSISLNQFALLPFLLC